MSRLPQDLTQGSFRRSSKFETQLNIKSNHHLLRESRKGFSQLSSVVIIAAMDFANIMIALSLAVIIRTQILPLLSNVFAPEIPIGLIDRLWWIPLISVIGLAYEGLYTRRLPFWMEVKHMVKAISLTAILVFAFVSLVGLSSEISRTVIIMGFLLSVILLPLGRLIVKTSLKPFGVGAQLVLILGAGRTGKLVASILLKGGYLGYRVIGFLDDKPLKKAQGVVVDGNHLPVLGGFRDSDRAVEETGARHLIVAAPGMQSHELVGLVNRLQSTVASVTVIPDLFGLPVMDVEPDYSLGEQILSFRIRNNLANPLNIIIKRIFDLIVGSIALVLITPLIAVISLAIKLDSQGPVFYSHTRIGKSGKEFKCYKFRTMRLENEEILRKLLEANPEAKQEWQKFAKLKRRDPRITQVGRILRKSSLDELPQIFNVLKGEMSLIGPRPYLPRERLRLLGYAPSILKSRPGITGLWQVNGRNDIDFDGRMSLESWYVRNWSLWLDITLLIRTVGVVLAKRGAY